MVKKYTLNGGKNKKKKKSRPKRTQSKPKSKPKPSPHHKRPLSDLMSVASKNRAIANTSPPQYTVKLVRGALLKTFNNQEAEKIPAEPEPDNAGEGNTN